MANKVTWLIELKHDVEEEADKPDAMQCGVKGVAKVDDKAVVGGRIFDDSIK